MDKAAAATVLVIEDHESVRIAIARFLRTGGFDTLEAETAEAARAMWAQHSNRISLFLVDIDLGGASGPDLVEQLQKERPEVPAIFVTATDDERARKDTFNFSNPT